MKVSLSARPLEDYAQRFKELDLSYKTLAGLPRAHIQSPVCRLDHPLDRYDFDFLFRYDVFPPEILRFYGEWQKRGGGMKPGDVIVQEAVLPPGRKASAKLLFGVRVLSAYRGKRAAGFSYGTLSGHPETGVNEFSFNVKGNSLFASVLTTAEPGLWVSKLAGPFFTRPYVNYCNRKALARLKENFIKRNARLLRGGGRVYAYSGRG